MGGQNDRCIVTQLCRLLFISHTVVFLGNSGNCPTFHLPVFYFQLSREKQPSYFPHHCDMSLKYWFLGKTPMLITGNRMIWNEISRKWSELHSHAAGFHLGCLFRRKENLELDIAECFHTTEGGLTVGAFRDVARIISRGKLRKSLCAVGCGVRSWELLK